MRFLEAYNALLPHSCSVFAVCLQNQPYVAIDFAETMKWKTEDMGEFIAEYLGPALAETSTEIWIHGGQKVNVVASTAGILSYSGVAQYVSGVAVHWYLFPPPVPGCHICTGAFAMLAKLRTYLEVSGHGHLRILSTEATAGFNAYMSPPAHGPDLGNWQRGHQFLEDVIGNANEGAEMWVDWNMGLSTQGGPNHASNACDAGILFDAERRVYYKQPIYYMLAHVTRFARPGSVRVAHSLTISDELSPFLWLLSLVDGSRSVLVAMNTHAEATLPIAVNGVRLGSFRSQIPPSSIQTYYWNV